MTGICDASQPGIVFQAVRYVEGSCNVIPPKIFLSTGVKDEWFFFGHEGIIQTGKVFYRIFQPWHAKLIVHHAKREIIRNKWLFGKDRIYIRFPVAGKAGKKSPVPFLLRANRDRKSNRLNSSH